MRNGLLWLLGFPPSEHDIFGLNGWTRGRIVAQWFQDMKRELKPHEREEIVAAVAAGDRVKATSIYLSATEGNLTEAQNFIKTLTAERIEAAEEAEEKSR